ncbi:MAG: hypothetical protein ACREM3_18415 [Candidatus Rokuibacteriota bacterium]
MKRRLVLRALGAGSVALLLPVPARANLLRAGNSVSLRCLGHGQSRTTYLDGRTRDASVGLAPELTPTFPGTRWKVYGAGTDIVALQCQGTAPGSKWLDGRTASGTVGLAPHAREPFTGTRWQVVRLDDHDPNIVGLKCLGEAKGSRWLDGRTVEAKVGLAPTTDPPFTGTRWEVRIYSVQLADPEGRPARD